MIRFEWRFSMLRFKFYLLVLVIFLSFNVFSYSQWIENENLSPGNVSLTNGVFHRTPDSKFILFSAGYNLNNKNYLGSHIIMLEMENFRVRDLFQNKTNYNLHEPVILNNSNNGSTIYFLNDFYLEKLEINENGFFVNNKKLFSPKLNVEIESIGAVRSNEAWYAADKIYRIDSLTDEWKEYSYPDDWDHEFSRLRIYITENENYLFLTSLGTNIQSYQALIFDIQNESFILLNKPDENFFNYVEDFDEWNNHSNKFLLLQEESLWVYDLISGDIQKIADGFVTDTKSIMQDNLGKYLYLFGESSIWFPSSSFYRIDLEDKKLEDLSFQLGDGFGFEPNSAVIDNENNRILVVLIDKINTTFRPVYIDLSDNKLYEFSDSRIEDNFEALFMFSVEENKMFVKGNDDSALFMMELDSGNIKKSISLGYRPQSWSIFGDKMYLSNLNGNQFFLRDFIGKRGLYQIDIESQRIAHFPDSSGILTILYEADDFAFYREYDFVNKEYNELEFSYNIWQDDFFLTDPNLNQNQILAVAEGIVYFIKPNQETTQLVIPEEIGNKKISSKFNSETSSLYVILNDKDVNEFSIYKVSTIDKDVKSNFKIQTEPKTTILTVEVDPMDRYLYLLNEIKGESRSRELVIVNLDDKEIIETYLLQNDVESPGKYYRVMPCIIPIPEKEKLFLWAYEASWCIDTENFEIVYGDTQTDPQGQYEINERLTGVWNNKNQVVRIYDNSRIFPEVDPDRILEVSLNSGEIIKSVEIYGVYEEVHFPKKRNEVNLLDPESLHITTLHLNPGWAEPCEIYPSTNYIQLGDGDKARFQVNIKNQYDYAQNATAYIWMFTPDGTLLFFDGLGLTFDIKGMPLSVPANLDITADILSFTMPAGVPEGFYNLNAVFLNENYDRGPIGTWNFYVKD